MKKLDKDIIELFTKRVFDIAGVTDRAGVLGGKVTK